MEQTDAETQNPGWGFWGTALRNGYDVKLTWFTCAAALARAFALDNRTTRALLDSRFGRHLADDLSFIPGGPDDQSKIEKHLNRRFADMAWKQWVTQSIQELEREQVQNLGNSRGGLQASL